MAVPLLLPLVVAVAVVIAFTMGRPILYPQLRGGLGGKVIRLWKFRSMTNERDETGALLPDNKRLTKVGRWIRSSSLDELPGFYSILTGDLSLVGPRPLVAEYLTLYNEFEARRHEVRPGITGWAQINGRNSLSWDEKFALDVWYVDNRSLLLDIRIILRTAIIVLRRDGINAPGSETAPPFERSASC
jgi:lipopolysaccharide/colanic/teichoic acid biosynthesis glycosyltransferase